jgi:hypothetical protein
MTNGQLDKLLTIFAMNGTHQQRNIFAYPCPMCKHTISCPPVESIMAREFISEVEIACGIVTEVGEIRDEREVTSWGYFDGLFLVG